MAGQKEITSDPIVDARAVAKTYRTKAAEVRAVRDATFALRADEFVALTGPSGCGKSTLLNLLACVDSPTSGTIIIDGRDVSALSDDDLTRVRRERIGYVFQFFNLIPTMSVRENVELPLLLSGASRARAKAAVDTALERTSIADQASKLPAYLSGGQQQRAAIARAVVHGPALVLADEPTGNLDSATGDEILGLLRSCAQAGAAVLMATHSLEAASKADRRLHMRDGALEH
ncbi:MAG TPA: ABC transporter ATP-binding protein [Candidatus Eremiobacteraceae bacterium]|nr:ABC transporter ATP-binding protein [Candidatus Eremiobacteraceae bacterium]